MRITFEPGDGSFEVLLDRDEKLPEEWNRKGVTVWRNMGTKYKLIKLSSEGKK